MMTASEPSNSLPDILECTCPACGYNVAAPFFDGGEQPLAKLAWPKSPTDAKAMDRLPLDYVQCLECSHIHNRSFEYANVPYSDKPNLMFNKGGNWSHFIRQIQEEILDRLPEYPTVVEIGYGDGSFLSSLAEMRPAGRYVGFDPHGAQCDSNLIELRREFFEATVHLPKLRPDIIISRHVLEHMTNPLGFLQKISCMAAAIRLNVQTYLEVPCVDRVLETGRTTDFYYEHSSQFTTQSFSRMLESSFASEAAVGYGYDQEVIYGFARLGSAGAQIHRADNASRFRGAARASNAAIQDQLSQLSATGNGVAIWGGTGKGAAFINRYGADADRFPVVIDSDYDKIGTFVPGTGQEIRSRDWLKNNPVGVVIIPSQWRAFDILGEIEELGLSFGQVLIEHNGRLIDLRTDPHPYRAAVA